MPADVGDALAFDVLVGGEVAEDGFDDVAGGGEAVIVESLVEVAAVWAHPATASAMTTPEAQRVARAGMQQSLPDIATPPRDRARGQPVSPTSWLRSLAESDSSQPSAALPFSIRKISIHVVVTSRPEAGNPMKSP